MFEQSTQDKYCTISYLFMQAHKRKLGDVRKEAKAFVIYVIIQIQILTLVTGNILFVGLCH